MPVKSSKKKEVISMTVCDRHGTETGRIVGRPSFCRMEGCGGVRLRVRWPDGQLTSVCTEDMFRRADGRWQLAAFSGLSERSRDV